MKGILINFIDDLQGIVNEPLTDSMSIGELKLKVAKLKLIRDISKEILKGLFHK